ncbi:hypothetical protein AS9A_3527 [Hoyosella subflava DQS3-9A1]|uniref:Uncharacterized protein n=1 Tax=Hoyosella subflava (strain DSM 45089 / JCM 17490 / NBRC 109087 / DQS3-9A1) TaxID=443218 RepID=F6ER89_HOYSD|nr:hypothetical protein AS9A_3527 [Hoyosella subflava DQS3-9A1]
MMPGAPGQWQPRLLASSCGSASASVSSARRVRFSKFGADAGLVCIGFHIEFNNCDVVLA